MPGRPAKNVCVGEHGQVSKKRALAKGPRRVVFLVLVLGLTAWLGPGLTGVRAVDEMEDPCMGEMQWIIGWCMDTASAGDALVTNDVAALALSAACPQHGSGFTSIDVPGAAATRAFGINAGGDIVGSYTDRAVPPVTHGYLLRDGVFTTIDYPAAPGAKTTFAAHLRGGASVGASHQVPQLD